MRKFLPQQGWIHARLHKVGPTYSHWGNKYKYRAVMGRPRITSASDIRSPDPCLSATCPNWFHTLGFKPRPPILGRQLFPTLSPYPLADVIFGWSLTVQFGKFLVLEKWHCQVVTYDYAIFTTANAAVQAGVKVALLRWKVGPVLVLLRMWEWGVHASHGTPDIRWADQIATHFARRLSAVSSQPSPSPCSLQWCEKWRGKALQCIIRYRFFPK